MNKRGAWTLPVLSMVVLSLGVDAAAGQEGAWAFAAGGPAGVAGPIPAAGVGMAPMAPPAVGGAPAGMPPPALPPAPPAAGMAPAGYMLVPAEAVVGAPGMPMTLLPDAYGAYGSMPMTPEVLQAMYGPPEGMPMPVPQGDDTCPYCGGAGCEFCMAEGLFGNHHRWLRGSLLGDLVRCIAPYPDGGCAAVRWFDFAVDYMALQRDDAGRNVNLTSLGIGGPIVLSTGQLDFGDYKSGFRFMGALQLAAANTLEFTYFGQFNFNTHARVRSPNDDLYSVLSQFGVVPLGGFAETDQSDFQQINYNSAFDSFEINWRLRWMAPNCRYQGSWTIGVRHFILDEKFRYATSSSANGTLTANGFVPARARFDVDTTNNLTGIQFGADTWICLLPGLRAGAELQAGVYGNHMNINTTAGVNTGAPTFTERLVSNDVSFIGQLNMLATYRISQQWTIRGGYQLLFVDGVALASENFNTAPPATFFPPTTRVSLVNDNGNVFYHGWNIGLEFMW